MLWLQMLLAHGATNVADGIRVHSNLMHTHQRQCCSSYIVTLIASEICSVMVSTTRMTPRACPTNICSPLRVATAVAAAVLPFGSASAASAGRSS